MCYKKRIRELRKEKGMTQTEIAKVLGTSQTMYARYERGANSIPVNHIIELAKLYSVTTDYILGLKDERK